MPGEIVLKRVSNDIPQISFSCAGWRLSGDLPMRRGETLPTSALPQTTSAGTSGEPSISNDLPKRDSMNIEEATISNMWEIAAIVKVLERKGFCTKHDLYDIITRFCRIPTPAFLRRRFLSRICSRRQRTQSSTAILELLTKNGLDMKARAMESRQGGDSLHRRSRGTADRRSTPWSSSRSWLSAA